MFKFAYCNKIKSFLGDLKNLQSLLDYIKSNFKKQFGVYPNDSEQKAFVHLISNMQNVLEVLPDRLGNIYIFIEFGMPFSSARADLIFLGKRKGNIKGIVVEHKQWSDECIQIEKKVLFVNNKEELHPYYQAEAYASYLKDYVEKLHEAEIISVAYLPNLKNWELLKFSSEIIFGLNSQNQFSKFILDEFDDGLSEEELNDILSSRFSPTKTLVNQVVNAIQHQKSWILLDEQKLVFERIVKESEELASSNKKKVFIIKGGPGTGKSAIALHLLGFFLKEGFSVVHITNSSAFTTTLKGILLENMNQKLDRLNGMFKLSHNFIKAKPNSFDIAICDEAHRFRKSTNFLWLKSNESQIYEIIRACKLSIFFIDENQIVRPGEDGTIEHVKEQAKRENAEIYEYELTVQFRNAGNENFVKWIDYILGIKSNKIDVSQWKRDFEFKIFDQIQDLENELSQKAQAGYSVRIVAGFVWPWNDPDSHGNLPLDVQIGNWKKPWNRKRPSVKVNPNKDPYFEWATRKDRQLDEVGCIYSAQGFEFDYVGVIWGNDLVIRNGNWVAQPGNSFDNLIKNRKPDNVLPLLKNTYRVLLSRGMKGCYLYFIDNETKEFFKKHLNNK